MHRGLDRQIGERRASRVGSQTPVSRRRPRWRQYRGLDRQIGEHRASRVGSRPPSHDGGHDGVSTVASIVEDIDLVNGKTDQHTAAHLLACIVAWFT
jgi:hypothetical protein